MATPIELQAASLLSIALAGLLGGLIGVDREARDKPAGIRTFAFVAMGSALFTLGGELAYPDADSSARVVAQIVSGVGFLGAGTILHLRGEAVVGLTTAASIWAAAGVGITCGLGLYVMAVGAAVLLVVALRLDDVGRLIRRRFGPRADSQAPRTGATHRPDGQT